MGEAVEGGGGETSEVRDGEMEERFRRIVEDRVHHSPYYLLLGMEVVDLEPGRATLRITVDSSRLHPEGYVLPGMIFSLADASSGVAMATLQDLGSRRVVTVEMKVNFLKPARCTELTGRGEVLYLEEDTAVVEAEVVDSTGEAVARSLATVMILQGDRRRG